MQWLRLVVPVVVILTLAGCSASLPSSPSKVRTRSTARQIAESIHGCAHISKSYVGNIVWKGTAAEVKKLNQSDTAVSCDLDGASLSIESNPAVTFPQTAGHSDPADYRLVGPTWGVDLAGNDPATSLKKQLSILTSVQAELGGTLLFDSKG